MKGIVPIKEFGTVEGIIEDIRLETYPSDYSETDRQVVVVDVKTRNGINRRFFYPYSNAPNSKLTMLVERVEELLGDEVEFLSDIIGYYSRWRQYNRKITLRDGDVVEVQVWLPTELRAKVPENFEAVEETEKERETPVKKPIEKPETSEDEVSDREILNFIEKHIEKYGSVSIKDVANALDVDRARVIDVASEAGYVIRRKVIFAE